MKSSIALSLLVLTLTACNATRAPIDEDALDAGAVQRHGYRPSGPPNPPAVWEDSIDAGSVQRRGYHPSGPPNAPVVWEDSIDAGRTARSLAAANAANAKSDPSSLAGSRRTAVESRGQVAVGSN